MKTSLVPTLFLLLLTLGCVEYKLGEEGWIKTWGGAQPDTGSRVAVDHDGNIYVAGRFAGLVDFDPGERVMQIDTTRTVENMTAVWTPSPSFREVYDEYAFLSKFDPDGNLLWTKSWGGYGRSLIHDCAIDPAGNIHVAGFCNGTLDLDPGEDTLPYEGGIGWNQFVSFVSKFDPDGNLLWSETGDLKRITWTENYTKVNQSTCDLSLDSDGNVYLATQGLMKYNSDGGLIWSIDWEGEDDSCIVDNEGNTYVMSEVNSLELFGEVVEEAGIRFNINTYYILSKFSRQGEMLWAYPWTGIQYPEYEILMYGRCHGVNIDSNGNIVAVISERSMSRVGLDSGHYGYAWGESQLVGIYKFDSGGNVGWSQAVLEYQGAIAREVVFDRDDNIYFVGSFTENFAFETNGRVRTYVSNGDRDCFIIKLDCDGWFEWIHTFGGPGEDVINDLAFDDDGNIYLTGIFSDTVSMGPMDIYEITSEGESDVFLVKLNQSDIPVVNLPD